MGLEANVKNIQDSGLVYYFEPNDLEFAKDQDGNDVAMMSHIEDMCISMSLTAEIFPRNKECIYTLKDIQDGKQKVVDKTISFISRLNNEKVHQQLVGQGMDLGGENYLTTYYTEISADQYIESELVEGLGVASVDISFESWYTPTVTIKFIDVRGSSLFGREEAIHEHGRITADNVLGVFFLQPYPLFRLQVKGFVGHPVTYQLTCSGFKGSYNSQTGNFEATVTFIGYSYSLLTDIPVKLLSAAPLMDYVGKSYWNAHVGSSQWEMRNDNGTTTTPPVLFELIDKIRIAIGSFDASNAYNCENQDINMTTVISGGQSQEQEGQNVALTDAATVTAAIDGNSEIGKVKTALLNFRNALDKMAHKYDGNLWYRRKDGREEWYIITAFPYAKDLQDIENHQYSEGDENIINCYEILNESIKNYNAKNPSNKLIYIKDLPENESFDRLLMSNKGKRSFTISSIPIGATRYIKRKVNNYMRIQKTKIESTSTVFTMNGVRLGVDNFKNIVAMEGSGVYCYRIGLGDLPFKVDQIEASTTGSGANVEANVEASNVGATQSVQTVSTATSEGDSVTKQLIKQKTIEGMLGFQPTIGNFVKLLMCHVETLIEALMVCGENIYSAMLDGNRDPEKLGVGDLSNTDISTYNTTGRNVDGKSQDKRVYPWPALYNPQKNNESKTPDGKGQKRNIQSEVMGWPADYDQTGAWEEQKFIVSVLDAIKKYEELLTASNNIHGQKGYSHIPLSGSDLALHSTPFYGVVSQCKTLEDVAPYLGLRLANVIGLGDHNCSADMAEAIGYMDALNMMKVSTDLGKLKELFTPLNSSADAITSIINYLLCYNNTGTSGGDVDGEGVHNNFEFIKGKTKYNNDNGRHPMFVVNNGTYTYSYIYNTNIDQNTFSVIPLELRPFDGSTNPYRSFFSQTESDGVTHFLPMVNSNLDYQGWINGGKSVKLGCITDTQKFTYTNNGMFNIIMETAEVESLKSQISSLRKGELKIQEKAIDGEENDEYVKKFLERRYKLGNKDYKEFFLYKNYNMFTPKIADVDEEYSKAHLYTSDNTKGDVTFNNSWFTNNKDGLFNKLTLTVDDEFNFKNGDKSYASHELNVSEIPIWINGDRQSLFGCQLYYAQNDAVPEFVEKDKALAKTYLLVNAMMSGFNIEKEFFKKDDINIIKIVPPIYCLFLGAALWRRQCMEGEESTDVIHWLEEMPAPSKDETLFTKTNHMCAIGNTKQDWYTIEELVGMPYDDIDIAVKNKLIKRFVVFATGCELIKVYDAYELRTAADGGHINSATWKGLSNKWHEDKFDVTKVSNWETILKIDNKAYASIVPSTNQLGLRLLFTPSNVSPTLMNICGLKEQWVLGRATPERVGKSKEEVTLRQDQIRGYLTGFKKRIEKIDAEVKKEEESQQEVPNKKVLDRDMAISMYYSIKHLWDTWLISAARDQFKIENFFNKYFIFIDSFYINIYDTLHINAEYINDAYSAEDPNLLTFMTSVTSKERCMFLALPEFLDSNAHKDSSVGGYADTNDLSVKKETLKEMFTPLPYNKMEPPSPNNVFVFVYTHPFSDCPTETSDKVFDSYMMNDENNRPDVLKQEPIILGTDGDRNYDENDLDPKMIMSNTLNPKEELLVARYGYKMPCFGVAVNRANNALFKSIKVNMDSPKITNIAAQSYENIMRKAGNTGSQRVFFHGQDIYSIYSQYSYTCEIEMVGCAQMQPLMYFQLMNIPMWRGTYMVYKVSHSMTPGNMTTKFTGIKMSRRQAPFAQGWFSLGEKNPESSVQAKINDNLDYSGEPITATEDTTTPSKLGSKKDGTQGQFCINESKNDGICVVGDSWSVGCATLVQYQCGKEGESVKKIKPYLQTALNKGVKKIIVLAGLNDITSQTLTSDIQKTYTEFGALCKAKGAAMVAINYPKNCFDNNVKIIDLNRGIVNGQNNENYAICDLSIYSCQYGSDGFHPTSASYRYIIDECKKLFSS